MISYEDFINFLKNKKFLDYKPVKNLYPDGSVRLFIDDTGKPLTVGELIKYYESLPYKEIVEKYKNGLLFTSKSTGQTVVLKDFDEYTDFYDALIFKVYPYDKE